MLGIWESEAMKAPRLKAEPLAMPMLPATRRSSAESGTPDSATASSLPARPAEEDAGRALVRLGCSSSEAETRLGTARARLTQAQVLRRSQTAHDFPKCDYCVFHRFIVVSKFE